MAKLEHNFTYTGTLGNVTAYRRRGSEQIILRVKGGPSKAKLRTHPNFENTRKNNKEFGGRSTASGWILNALYDLKPLSDYNMAALLNKTLVPVQELDNISEYGTKEIALSKAPGILENF